MAAPFVIETALEELAGNYGKHPQWIAAARGPWQKQLRDIGDDALREAVARWMADPEHEYPPTPAKLLVRSDGASTGPASCGKCCDGIREIAVHRQIGGEVVVKVGCVRCDCDAGEAVDRGDAKDQRRRPRMPDLKGQCAFLDADLSCIRYFVDPTPRQMERLDVARPNVRSKAIDYVRGLMVPDPDENAGRRAAAVRREEDEREATW